MQVVLATSNAGKVREARAILEPVGIEIVTRPLWLGDVENGLTYVENARAKALAAQRMLRTAVLAEDSGIEVDALGGLPGVHSARFAGEDASDDANNAKLLHLLDGVPAELRTARYRAFAVLLFSDGSEIVGEGTFEGSIVDAPRGTKGFGYDPLFVPAGMTVTSGELDPDEKNRLSHRGAALRSLSDQLR